MLLCHKLSVQQQNTQRLHPLDLKINQGERWVVIGRNGSGKTTLLKALVNLLPFKGEVVINQLPLRKLTCQQRAKQISYLPQHSQVDGRLTLREYIQLTASNQATSSFSLDQTSKALKIDTFLERRMGQLSGGQKQRAHIARSLCQNTEFLVLDEPLNHLDPCAQGEVLSLLKEQGKTLICSLHDISLAAKFATHIAILEHGQVVAKGKVEELLTHNQLKPIFEVDLISTTNKRTQKTSKFFDIELDQGQELS
ncbi:MULTISPECIES: ABC transporter ATP-binding protein [unclassified Vibrio]|uniref:ABC transporter ATP-binding protein n=1 Tax=unclassified Vibrio TaxID=2614977 RepID=UPI0035513027